MGITDFASTAEEWVNEEGILGTRYILDQAWMGILRRSSPLFEPGINIYERDWDLLIVLDACRVDAMEEVADSYSFLADVNTHRSTASTSGEWMRTSFTEEHEQEVRNTVYVSANQHSSEVEAHPFLNFEDVYNYGWDSEHGTVLADTVTDVAIEAGRESAGSRQRMIVHYMQPHFPSIPKPIGHGNKFDNVWKGLMIGRGDRDEIWKSYIENLRYVLDHVEGLLENIDAGTVAITADHGNAMGEWGVYDHPLGVPIDCVKTVPWCTTSASDERTRTPSVTKSESEVETAVDDRLESLGYR
ncbi:sulfatase-like hydrolase/transferase [Halobacterium salinarum]|uniref:sulfatase-like hydrolase/transferase n=1 Tax=Halobacterium salinarum TaxID=2242 RepID=UPI0025524341|nr:sulfatase-like hydrolase/transferase [Halobacterium salinarum]MDL0136572.1 sulfatase-like hydrolase/transferase [Halobacterium salinarum]MDL0140455.1 sulfatase-like hydrolase/transferase [Halobacterium salinarum]